MAGLCEGGNEPSGSLKAICKEKAESDALAGLKVIEIGPATSKPSGSRNSIPFVEGPNNPHPGETKALKWLETRRLHHLSCLEKVNYITQPQSSKYGLSTEGMRIKHCDKEERARGKVMR
ncbi:hypothetical protein ANN_14907 [Periplaneta americana]|uniref:Uncharacterized protein n=1 Tax=Periplaneta americana TaxID=6978 RepID=A0ABQ8SY78_PERAM|nr:hypothetical protein ANN_14907 [Periplaneta americana]